MKNKIIILDDTCRSSSTESGRTFFAICESMTEREFIFVQTNELTEEVLNNTSIDDTWVIGNTFALTPDSIKVLNVILMLRKFVKIEFDYGFCNYRSAGGFKYFTDEKEWEPFGPKGSSILKGIYALQCKMAKKIFYLSEAQRQIHNKMLDFVKIDEDKQKVLGQCFSTSTLAGLVSLAGNHTKDSYAIINHTNENISKKDGFKESVLYAKENALKFEILMGTNHDAMLTALSEYKGLIFLPNFELPCPRIIIEAKLMELEIITNENSQNTSEDWFSLEEDDLANYMLERPLVFSKEFK